MQTSVTEKECLCRSIACASRQKNLQRYLPDFVAAHANSGLTLSACQELAARINGYPSWHAAVHKLETAASTGPAPSNAPPLTEGGMTPEEFAHSIYLKVDAMDDDARNLQRSAITT